MEPMHQPFSRNLPLPQSPFDPSLAPSERLFIERYRRLGLGDQQRLMVTIEAMLAVTGPLAAFGSPSN